MCAAETYRRNLPPYLTVKIYHARRILLISHGTELFDLPTQRISKTRAQVSWRSLDIRGCRPLFISM